MTRIRVPLLDRLSAYSQTWAESVGRPPKALYPNEFGGIRPMLPNSFGSTPRTLGAFRRQGRHVQQELRLVANDAHVDDLDGEARRRLIAKRLFPHLVEGIAVAHVLHVNADLDHVID